MAQAKLPMHIRIMALEIIMADMLATVHRTTADPLLSLKAKQHKFRWFFRENRRPIQDKLRDRFYSEEIELAVDGIFDMSEALLHRRDLT
jgi:hypothetical protein